MDASLATTSGLAASYEAGQASPVDPMDLTIRETMDKLNGIRQEVAEMNNKITYLRDIRARGLALLAQADAAEEEASRLELEQSSLDKEVERLTAVVYRMEDMRISTKQLTDQMQLDTALQMRHILENGKSIVPRVPPNARLKRNLSEERSGDVSQPLFKMPRRDTNESTSTAGALVNVVSRPPSASSPSANNAIANTSAAAALQRNYSPHRSSPGSLASMAALAGAAGGLEASRSSQSQPGSATFLDLSTLPASISQSASVSPPIGMPTSSSTSSASHASVLAPLATTTVVTTSSLAPASSSNPAASQFTTTTSPVTVTMFSHHAGSGGSGMGTGMLYHHQHPPPPSNMFLSSSTSSLAHESALDSDDVEDVKPAIGGRDILYR